MKVLHIVAGDLGGGAARGAYWLHQELRRLGVDSIILTDSRATYDDPSVFSIRTNIFGRALGYVRRQIDKLPSRLYLNREKRIFSTGIIGVDFTNTRHYRNADLVHLHWICKGLINMKHLSKVDKPIVWTLRDMWPFTGGCHYSLDCVNFRSGCGECMQLHSEKVNDLSAFILRRKKKYIPPAMQIVGISTWITEQARSSALFRAFNLRTIENNVRVDDFYRIDKSSARHELGIETNKKIILVGATGLNDFYKGFSKFIESLSFLDPSEYYLCFFGSTGSSELDGLGFEYTSLGYLTDQSALRNAYSCADVFVAPSVMEAFGKTLVEAMACETPVVCFDATGPKDIVTHQKNGYKALPFDSGSLAEGIKWVANAPNYQELCTNARNTALGKFDSKVVAKKYVELYKEMLSKSN